MAKLVQKLWILLALAIGLSACGPMNNPIGEVNDDALLATKNHTGGEKIIKTKDNENLIVPYTNSGSQKIFNDMRSEMESVTDLLLAKTIESVIIILKNDKNVVTDKAPSQLEMIVKVKAVHAGLPAELKFKTKLSLKENHRIATNIAQSDAKKNDFAFTADFKCHDVNCRAIEIRIKKYPVGTNLTLKSPAVPFGQVGILYRFSYPKIRVLHGRNQDKFTASSFLALEKSAPTSQAVRTSVVVVNGPSYSRVQVPNLLELDTELLDTQEASVEVKSVKVKEDSKLTGELSGNDPSTGSLVVDVKNTETKEVARIFFEEEVEETTPASRVEIPAEAMPGGIPMPRDASPGLFKIKFDPKGLPATARVTSAFSDYASDPQVQKFVKAWLGEKQELGCKNPKSKTRRNLPSGPTTLKKFLTYAPNITPHLENVVEKLDVTPEIGYLLLIESAYAKDPSYPALQRPPKGTALGPWQILHGTATYIRSLTKPTVPFQIYKSPSSNDDRTYFINSTYMAAIYLDYLFDQFEEDPAIAILAYHGGPGTASSAEKKTNSYTQFKTTLPEILKYNMQTKTNCDYINYTYTFLAARTIGQNLKFYGLDNIAPAKTDAYKARLKNPNSFLPVGL